MARLTILLAAAVVIAGCSPDASGVALPPKGAEVAVEIIEHAVVYEDPVPAGRVVFRIDNVGEHPHQLTLLSLAEDTPSIEEQVLDPPEVPPDMVARIPPLGPGESGMFAAWLAEGQRYALIDLSEAPDGSANAQLGVVAEFRAGGDS